MVAIPAGAPKHSLVVCHCVGIRISPEKPVSSLYFCLTRRGISASEKRQRDQFTYFCPDTSPIIQWDSKIYLVPPSNAIGYPQASTEDVSKITFIQHLSEQFISSMKTTQRDG